MMDVCCVENCCGCLECTYVCQKHAIDKIKVNGFTYPKINNKICVGCNACINNCQGNNELELNQIKKAYAAFAKNEDERMTSISGGIFSVIGRIFLDNKNVVCGAVFDENFEVIHDTFFECEDLERIKGSKYIQSDIGGIYKKIEKAIEADRKVLFCGTPCQCYALKTAFKDNSKLFLIDLVCHGTPSYSFFKKWLNEIQDKYKSEIVSVKFKDKKFSWTFAENVYTLKNSNVLRMNIENDPYFCLFVNNYTLRESCYKCRFSQSKRVGDLTICDYWGYSPSSAKFRNFDKGVSCLAINSKKGFELLEMSKNMIVTEEKKVEEIINTNRNFSFPQKKPSDYLDFINDLEKGISVQNLYEKYIRKKRGLSKIEKKIIIYIRSFWFLVPERVKSFMLKKWRNRK